MTAPKTIVVSKDEEAPEDDGAAWRASRSCTLGRRRQIAGPHAASGSSYRTASRFRQRPSFVSRLDCLRLACSALTWACSRQQAIKGVNYLIRHSVSGEPQRLVDMDIALRHAARRVAEQRRDRQFGKAAVASGACEGVAQRMRVTSSSRAIAQTRSSTRTIPAKCPSPQSVGKEKRDPACG